MMFQRETKSQKMSSLKLPSLSFCSFVNNKFTDLYIMFSAGKNEFLIMQKVHSMQVGTLLIQSKVVCEPMSG